jgi:adenine-specific DNA-methyltransferase
MMYPRLYLARNLLSEDGVIFVSIDDHEVNNLKQLLNELFGEESFVGQIAVVNNLKGRNDKRYIATAHDYLLIYANDTFESAGLPLTEKQRSEYREQAENGIAFQWRDLRKRGGADTRALRPRLYFPLYADPSTGNVSLDRTKKHVVEIFPTKSDGTDGCWRWGFQAVQKNLSDLRAVKVEAKERWNVNYRVYIEKDGETRTAKPKSVWLGPELSTDRATKALRALMPEVTDITPKPPDLIALITRFAADSDDIILDFFAGTGTTGQAVLELNKEDGGNRRFILVQLPEPTGRDDLRTVSEITKERVRRFIQKLNTEDVHKLDLEDASKQDRGFQVFKLAESNFKTWDANRSDNAQQLEQQLEMHVDHLRAGRTAPDFLYEILLKSGFPLTAKVEKLSLGGLDVFSVAGGALLICLERQLTLDVIRTMADRKPERVVCLDEGFVGNDQLKTNAVQTFKSKGVVFRTV